MLDGKKLDSDSVEWDQYWNPKISLENGIGDPKTTTKLSVSYDRNGRATVTEMRNINGTFFEYMELYHFPFDQQDLTVTVVSDRDTTELELVEDPIDKCGINATAFSSEQEWELHGSLKAWRKTVTKKANKMTRKHPAFSCAAKASRRPQFFIWNIILIMSTICSMAFATFSVALNTPHSRLPLTFILLLTTVTFKFVVNKSLPRISYLTYMDKYILAMMVLLNGVCVWHAVVSVINSYVYKTSIPAVVSTTTTTTTTMMTTVSVTGCANQTTAAATTTAPSTSVPITEEGLKADYIALGIFISLFIALHLVFVFMIACCGNDDDHRQTPEDEDVSDAVSGQTTANQTAVDAKTVQIALNNGSATVYNNLAYHDRDGKNNRAAAAAAGGQSQPSGHRLDRIEIIY
jgi:hypothetical protein